MVKYILKVFYGIVVSFHDITKLAKLGHIVREYGGDNDYYLEDSLLVNMIMSDENIEDDFLFELEKYYPKDISQYIYQFCLPIENNTHIKEWVDECLDDLILPHQLRFYHIQDEQIALGYLFYAMDTWHMDVAKTEFPTKLKIDIDIFLEKHFNKKGGIFLSQIYC